MQWNFKMKKPHIESSFMVSVYKRRAAAQKVIMHPEVPTTGQVVQIFP
jgi:hypothetical protein